MKLHIKKHWRIWLLVVFLAAGTIAIFGPLGDESDDGSTEALENETAGDLEGEISETSAEDGGTATETESALTNLNFGLELSGGTQVRAPFIGMTVSNVDFGPDDQSNIEQVLQEELNLSISNVRASYNQESGDGTVEVFRDEYVSDVDRGEFAAAMREAATT